MNILACDIGFGYTKYIFAQINENNATILKKEKFPSAIRPISFISNDFNISEHPDFVKIENKNYFVGESALITDKGLRIRNSDFLLENIPVFLFKIFNNLKLSPDKIDILILGTPFSEWKRLKQKIIDKTKNFFKEEIYCIPQAAAASLIVNPKWNYALVLDIGFNTCDVVPVDSQGRIIADEGISWEKLGVSSILDEVDNFCKNILGLTLTPIDIENIVIRPKNIKKIIKISDDFINSFQNKIQTIIDEKFYYINAKLLDKYGNSFDKLILVGGGNFIFKKFFKKAYPKKLILPKHSEFANVIGFLLYGLSQIEFNGEIIWEIISKDKDNQENKNIKNESLQEEENSDILEEKNEEIEKVVN